MNAEQIIKIGKDLYEFKRLQESAASDGEQLLFDACCAMQQLQSKIAELETENKERKAEITKLYIHLETTVDDSDEKRAQLQAEFYEMKMKVMIAEKILKQY